MGITDEEKKKKNNDPELTPLQKKMLKILPLEKDEETNQKIKLYNEIVRHAMVYDQNPFSLGEMLSNEDVERIFHYVLHDYPEIFWVENCSWGGGQIKLIYRCINEDGVLDVKQIDRKRDALKKASKHFTRGITKKTKPYDALITIYRRLILALDYDGRGLSAGIDRDTSQDDRLRSLYSAIVEHKVVCAGYAAAMQYLLQSVGISCGYVSSNRVDGGGHAFNALKIGKYCYYLDATWGDFSNTTTGNDYKNDIYYDYCCVPLREFLITGGNPQQLHMPNSEFYPNLEEFTATNHEYFRFRKAYLTRYDEQAIVNVFANTALSYDQKEMGNFTIGFRCNDKALARYVVSQICVATNYDRIISKAIDIVKKKKRSAVKLLSKPFKGIATHETTFYVHFK